MGSIESNFFPVNRSLQNHWLWQEKPFSKGQAWIDLLMLANYEETRRPFKGEVVTVKAGQVCCSKLFLAERWGWERKKVDRYLALLESDKMVQVNTTTHGTTITIENYSKFNLSRTANTTTDGTTDGQPTGITKKVKKVKNINNNNIFSAPTVEQVREYCFLRGNTVDPEKFVAYYESNGWKVGRNPMKDWKAAVRTWEHGKNGNSNQKSKFSGVGTSI